MAYRDLAHQQEVFQTTEYRRMVSEWIGNNSPVPLSVFQKAYGEAFFNRRGETQRWNRTETSRRAFANLMNWTGRAERSVNLPHTAEEWEEFDLEYD